ncbi:hypothetical protein DICA3_E01596 [Diutina catenulata]
MRSLGFDEVTQIGLFLDVDSLYTLVQVVRCDSQLRHVYDALTNTSLELQVMDSHDIPPSALVSTFDTFTLTVGETSGLAVEFVNSILDSTTAITVLNYTTGVPPKWHDKVTGISVVPQNALSFSSFSNLKRLHLDLLSGSESLDCLTSSTLSEVAIDCGSVTPHPMRLGRNIKVFKFRGNSGPVFEDDHFPSLVSLQLSSSPPTFTENTNPASFPHLIRIDCVEPIEVGPAFVSNLSFIQNCYTGSLECSLPPHLLSYKSLSRINYPQTLRVLHMTSGVPHGFALPPNVYDLAIFDINEELTSPMFASWGNLLALSLEARNNSSWSIEEGCDFSSLPQLRILSLRGFCSPHLRISPQVEEITLCDCQLKSAQIPRSVTKLDISNNKLSALPVDETYIHLQELDISNNLWAAELVVDAPNLKRLTLQNTEVVDLVIAPTIREIHAKGSFLKTQKVVGHNNRDRYHVVSNQTLLSADNRYAYHPQTKNVHITLLKDFNPTIWDFPETSSANISLSSYISPRRMATILDGCQAHSLKLFTNHFPSVQHPIGVPGPVKILTIKHLGNRGNDDFGILTLSPSNLRELNVVDSADAYITPVFVNGVPPNLAYLNGTQFIHSP